MSIVGRWYLENGNPVQVLIQWKHAPPGVAKAWDGEAWVEKKIYAPRNVMIYRSADKTTVVRPFRGLRLPDPRTLLEVHTRAMGWPMTYDRAARLWVYLDSGEPVSVRRRCVACDQMETPEGHDPCIANLPGVHAACCGHGLPLGTPSAYVMFQHPTLLGEGTHNGALRRQAALDWFAEQGRTVPVELNAAALQRVRDAFPGQTKG